MSKDYNATLNLPSTDFAMRANLPKREPDMIKKKDEKKIYSRLLEKNAGKPSFILHDGPPFSNGNIHMGTALNKILKDFIVRYKAMTGHYAPYVPGWDNHGMPIESAIIKKNKLDRKNMSIPEFRNACRDFALNFVDIQRSQFIRLGVMGDWENPYMTLTPEFEAEEVKVFGKMYEKGYIYKGLKPVYWCPHDETALAEAEIEYANDKCTSIYVRFKVSDDKGKLAGLCDLDNTYFVIWTTTTWTIPGNLAICLNPDLEYALMKVESGETYIVAKELAEGFAKRIGQENYEFTAVIKGSEFELMSARHPLYDRDSLIILGRHVTLDAGTGCVHTAPGHGLDDYNACRNYNIDILVPVDSRGHMTAEAGKYEGMYYEKANTAIFEDLKECGALVAWEDIEHSYPHCWRCKKPVIYRATPQWFCSVEAFRKEAVDACDSVSWTPAWGYERMKSMIAERADWCISRQRHWGLPIPAFYCSDCGKPVCTPETIEAVSALFGKEGSNAWYEKDASQILPEGFTCPHCGGKTFTKETDTLDGWFDSGSTHIASLAKNDETQWPSDLYLEGADQYRGWFQSSLLTAVAVRGKAPYKAVLTHGWVVDGEGKAMHKSLGNSIAPEEMIEKYGADLVRLWVASSDYRVDVRVSDPIFKQLSQAYLKIRNTARYILGNLNGFDPDKAVAYDDMLELDKWALSRLNKLVAKVRDSYDSYEFHGIYHAVRNFCVTDMSNFYLDIIKDRLYCEAEDSLARRSAQTAMFIVLDTMVRLLAPVLVFTTDEIWEHMPHRSCEDKDSVMFSSMPEVDASLDFDAAKEERWDALMAVRLDVNKAIENARAEKLVGKSLDAEVTIYVSEAAKEGFDKACCMDLAECFIVSDVNVVYGQGEGYVSENFEGLTVSVKASEKPMCGRCWTHHEAVGENGLCPRCAGVVEK